MIRLRNLALAAAGLAAPLLAQEPDQQATYRAEYEKKIAKDFVSYGNWVLDYGAARARAKAEGKLILAYFTVSWFR
jgi:hypothetical protein